MTEQIVFDRYRLVEQIGVGGMGVVWRATDVVLDQTVALKRISLAAVDGEQAELVRARALREARTSARLRHHPHVISTFDVQISDGDVWLVLEYLAGRNLGALARGRRLSLVEVARIGAAVADALASGHELGIVHRDVTPGNVLVADDGTVKLTDFGISYLTGESRLTQDNVLSGTIAYLAPEVAAGGEATFASDVFSLGATLYAAVEGEPPFGTDDNPVRLLNLVRTGISRTPVRAGVLGPVLARLLEPDPAARPDAGAARELLIAFAAGIEPGTADQNEGPGTVQRAETVRSVNTARLRASAVTAVGPEDAAAAAPPNRPIVPRAASTGQPALPLTPPANSWVPPARQPRRPPRRRAVIAGLITLGLVALGGTTAILVGASAHSSQTAAPASGPTPIPTAAPVVVARPKPIGSIFLTGDQKQVDPCALVDLARLSGFGVASIDKPQFMASCAVRIYTAAGNAMLSVDFQSPANRDAGLAEQFGGVQVLHENEINSSFGPRCRNVLLLTDRTRIFIDAIAGNGGVDRCALADAAAYIAIDRLGQHGLTYRPNRAARWRTGAIDACAVVSNVELASIARAEPAIRTPGFANWSCTWGTNSAGVALGLRLDGASTQTYGKPTDLDGHRAWLRTVTGPRYSHCDATVVSHQASTATDDTELVLVSVSGLNTDPSLCDRAGNLAKAALARLPS